MPEGVTSQMATKATTGTGIGQIKTHSDNNQTKGLEKFFPITASVT